MPTAPELLDLWLRAIHEPTGLGIRTPPPTAAFPVPSKRLSIMLHHAREHAPPALKEVIAHLSLRISPREPTTVLYIVRERPQANGAGELPFPEESVP